MDDALLLFRLEKFTGVSFRLVGIPDVAPEAAIRQGYVYSVLVSPVLALAADFHLLPLLLVTLAIKPKPSVCSASGLSAFWPVSPAVFSSAIRSSLLVPHQHPKQYISPGIIEPLQTGQVSRGEWSTASGISLPTVQPLLRLCLDRFYCVLSTGLGRVEHCFARLVSGLPIRDAGRD